MFEKGDIVQYKDQSIFKPEYKNRQLFIYKLYDDFAVVCEVETLNKCHHVRYEELELVLC